MSDVSVKQDLPVPASVVWATIGNFNALPDWHPAVEKSDLEKKDGDTTRTLHLAGGGQIVEKLQKIDDKERLYTYSILSGPLPVANYTSTIRVIDKGNTCTVEWSSSFEPSGAPETDAVAAIRGVYQAGFENLKRMYGAK